MHINVHGEHTYTDKKIDRSHFKIDAMRLKDTFRSNTEQASEAALAEGVQVGEPSETAEALEPPPPPPPSELFKNLVKEYYDYRIQDLKKNYTKACPTCKTKYAKLLNQCVLCKKYMCQERLERPTGELWPKHADGCGAIRHVCETHR